MSSLESGQPPGGFEQPKPPSRPSAVTLALLLFIIILCYDVIAGFSEGLGGGPLFTPGSDLTYKLFTLFCLWPLFVGLFLVMILYFPLWFIRRQKNWARWYAVFLTGLLLIIAVTTQASFYLAATLLVNTIATVALFLPSSNQWFRAPKKGPPPLPP